MKLISFSYKSGQVPPADLIVDCRSLRNPHFYDDLRHLDGKDPRVQAFVQSDGKFYIIVDTIQHVLQEGKVQSIAFGCFGGRHRSVAVVELLAMGMRTNQIPVTVEHLALKASN